MRYKRYISYCREFVLLQEKADGWCLPSAALVGRCQRSPHARSQLDIATSALAIRNDCCSVVTKINSLEYIWYVQSGCHWSVTTGCEKIGKCVKPVTCWHQDDSCHTEYHSEKWINRLISHYSWHIVFVLISVIWSACLSQQTLALSQDMNTTKDVFLVPPSSTWHHLPNSVWRSTPHLNKLLTQLHHLDGLHLPPRRSAPFFINTFPFHRCLTFDMEQITQSGWIAFNSGPFRFVRLAVM